MEIGKAKVIACTCLVSYLLVSNNAADNFKEEDPDNFGLMGEYRGTVASGASISVVRIADLTPLGVPNVSEHLRLNHGSYLMENIKETRNV